jgi:hypothetical protein
VSSLKKNKQKKRTLEKIELKTVTCAHHELILTWANESTKNRVGTEEIETQSKQKQKKRKKRRKMKSSNKTRKHISWANYRFYPHPCWVPHLRQLGESIELSADQMER